MCLIRLIRRICNRQTKQETKPTPAPMVETPKLVQASRYTESRCEWESDAYNLPIDTIYYLESEWNYVQNNYVKTHLQEIEDYINRYVVGSDGYYPYRLVYVSRQNADVYNLLGPLNPGLPEWHEEQKAVDPDKLFRTGRKAREKKNYVKINFIARLVPVADETYRFVACDTEMHPVRELMSVLCSYVRRLVEENHRILLTGKHKWEPGNSTGHYCDYYAALGLKPYQDDGDVRFSMGGGGYSWRDEYNALKSKQALTAQEQRRLAELEARLEKIRQEEEEEKRREAAAREKALRIKEQIDELQRDNRISILAEMLGETLLKQLRKAQPARISELCIDEHYMIRLPLYDMTIDLATLPKALYVLFLRHPEGIQKEDLDRYEDELMTIYLTMSGRTDVETMRKSVRELVMPGSDSLNQKISRINAAFRNHLAESIAAHYIIIGPRGEAKKVEAASEAKLTDELAFGKRC